MAKKKAPKKKETKQSRAAKWKNPPLLTDGKDKPAEKLAKVVPAEVMLSKPAAEKLNVEIRADIQGAEDKLIQAAIKIDTFVRGEGWKALGYKGLTEWRKAEMEFSTFYNARSAMKLLEAGVPPERIQKMSLTNMNALTRQLPESQWKDEKILEAATGPVAAFEKRVTKKSEDMGQHVEEEVPRGFKIPKTVADNWDLALKVAMVVDGCTSMEQRVEVILATYLNSASEVPDKSRLQLFRDNYEEDKKS